MSRTVFRLLTLPAAAAVIVAVATADPTTLAGAESVSEAELFESAADPELTAVNRELSARLEVVAARTELKEDLIARLAAGRLGLVEVADRFLDLNREAPECLAMVRHHFPASDDRESAARNVMEFVQQRTAPAAWPALQARLAGEYQAAFHHAPEQ